MKIADAPTQQPVAFATNGTKDTITATTDTGSNNASYDVGFPDITMLLKSAGGLAPKGGNFNQILYELSSAAQYLSAGGGYPYDSTFSTGISGYPVGALIQASDQSGYWLNGTDANTTSPENSDGTLTGWVPVAHQGQTIISGLAATSVTLTALQAGKDRIVLQGTLTANIQIILPLWVKKWTIVNQCTGSYTVTVIGNSGTGYAVSTSSSIDVWCNGTNFYAYASSPYLPGVPTADTATAGTSTTQLATTAFVTTAVANAGYGRLIKRTVISSSGTFSYQSETTMAFVQLVGAGGGGGGAEGTGTTSNISGGSGGGAGGYAEVLITSSSNLVTTSVTIGTAGTGGNGASGGSASNGGSGGATSFGSLCAANGGGGGTYQTVSSGSTIYQQLGGTGAAGSIGDRGSRGNCGGRLFSTSTANSTAGEGGASAFSSGQRGPGGSTASAGGAGTQGAGGAGAINASGSSSGLSGGAGGPGMIIVWEYA